MKLSSRSPCSVVILSKEGRQTKAEVKYLLEDPLLDGLVLKFTKLSLYQNNIKKKSVIRGEILRVNLKENAGDNSGDN